MNRFARTARSVAMSLRMVILSANFWIAVALIFGVLFAEIAEDVFSGYAGDGPDAFGAAYSFNISMHFGYFIYAAPLACAFAASGSLINDTEAGFYRLRLMKSGKHEYSIGMFIGTSIGGGLALMLGMLLFASVCALQYGTRASIADMAALDAWFPLVSSTNSHWKYMIVSALLAFLFGSLWSGVGLTVSVYSPVRYVSYLTPFIICFCSALALPVSLQPLEMLVQMNWEDFTFPKLLMYQLVLYCAVMLWFDYVVERRIIHEQN